jgi:hypothetical protein
MNSPITSNIKKISYEVGDPFVCVAPFKDFEKGEKYIVFKIIEYRWSSECAYYAYTHKGKFDLKPPKLTSFHDNDFNKIIKL